MVAAIRQFVTVQPGGVISIRSDQLCPGARAEVIVRVVDESPQASRSLTSFIGSGKGAFSSVEEIDSYIREIRDWGDRDRDP